MTEIPRWPIGAVFLAFGLYAAFKLIRALRSGVARSGDIKWPAMVSRQAQPALFWFYVVGWLVGAVSGVAVGLILIVVPNAFMGLSR